MAVLKDTAWIVISEWSWGRRRSFNGSCSQVRIEDKGGLDVIAGIFPTHGVTSVSLCL